MATSNHLGKTLYVATALPASNDAAGFEALTWVKANGLQTAPQFGITHTTTDVDDLESGFGKGIKDMGMGVESTMAFRDIGSTDAGQEDIKTQANGATGNISLKLVKGSGTDNAPVAGDPVTYAQGIAHSYQENKAEKGSFEGFMASFRQNEDTVKATEPV